jgi:hypothetical protein
MGINSTSAAPGGAGLAIQDKMALASISIPRELPRQNKFPRYKNASEKSWD